MYPKNKYHQIILKEIKSYSHSEKPDYEGFGLKYVGTDKPSYHLNTKDIQTISKSFLRTNKISVHDIHELLDSLYFGDTYEEINIGAKIIQFSKDTRKNIDFNKLNSWLDRVHGWAEVDTLCSMAFTSEDILPRWSEWKDFLKSLNHDKNVHKRRASLVLLVKPTGNEPDKRLSDLAFENVDNLKHEKDILITKAISWILRALIKNHRQQVDEYLNKNHDSLPKIAIREVRSKLETGKKYINKKKLHDK